MKVLHISTFDFGGAANSCIRLHSGLLNLNIESKVLFGIKKKDIACTYQFENINSNVQKFENKLKRIASELKLIKQDKYSRETKFINSRNPYLEAFSYPFSSARITDHQIFKDADIVNLHWVANFLDWPSFFKSVNKPIVWTLHDQNPFLGGEHYAERFIGIDDDGLPIPRRYSDWENSEEQRLIKIKLSSIKGLNNLNIVAPSKWLCDESLKSEMFKGFPHHHIPYGLPTSIFKQFDKAFSRSIFGLPFNRFIILFVADSVGSTRKGFKFLIKALNELVNLNYSNLTICTVGNPIDRHDLGFEIIELGRIVDERLMALAYNAADCFVIPSLEDNLPNTLLEAVSCGTPVIGFPVGGIPEVINNGFNGFITDKINTESLVLKLKDFLDNPMVFNRNDISNFAKTNYDEKVQAIRYNELYTTLLDTNKF